jgi:hypothetical protein
MPDADQPEIVVKLIINDLIRKEFCAARRAMELSSACETTSATGDGKDLYPTRISSGPRLPPQPVQRSLITSQTEAQPGSAVRDEWEAPEATKSQRTAWIFPRWSFANTNPSTQGMQALGNSNMSFREQLDVERTNIVSNYSLQLEEQRTKFEKEADELKEELEKERKEKAALKTDMLVKERKLQAMSKTLTRAGRSESVLLDPDISQRFGDLRSDIMNLAKRHFSYFQLPPDIDTYIALPDITELVIRSIIANYLYSNFFSRDTMLFGLEDEQFSKSPFKIFERQLRDNGCNGK